MENQQAMTETNFQKSTYFIGDLCYVLNDEDWEVLCPQIDGSGEECEVWLDENGERTAIVFPTMFGDGVYEDQEGRSYSVDSGTIGAIEVRFADPFKVSEAVRNGLGHLVEFVELDAGECGYDEGLIAFGQMQNGSVFIDTAV